MALATCDLAKRSVGAVALRVLGGMQRCGSGEWGEKGTGEGLPRPPIPNRRVRSGWGPWRWAVCGPVQGPGWPQCGEGQKAGHVRV